MRPSNIEELKLKYIGTTNNQLSVIDVLKKGPRNEVYLKCKCSCGNTTNTLMCRFKKTKSCGCHTRNNKSNYSAAFNMVYNSYKSGAKRRKLYFFLSKEEFKHLTAQKCVYCSKEPSTLKESKCSSYLYNGIDRADNNVGYTVDNSVTCCKRCNFFKSSLNIDDFIELVTKIAKNNTVSIGISLHKLDGYFARTEVIAKNSHDSETQVGAILIDNKSGSVKAEGYNGFVRGADDKKLPSTRPEKYKYMIHAEMNLICNAVRSGISMDKCTVFCTLSPCKNCARALYQTGVETIYFKNKYGDLDESIDMGDLLIDIEPIDKYFKMSLKPSNND